MLRGECWRIQNRRHHGDGAVAVTIGAGGAVLLGRHKHCGKRGSPSSIGALATAAGGAAPPTPNTGNDGCGGNGAGWNRLFHNGHNPYARRWRRDGVNGVAGGGGGSATYGAWQLCAAPMAAGMELYSASGCRKPRPPQAPRKLWLRWRSGIKRLQHRNKNQRCWIWLVPNCAV